MKESLYEQLSALVDDELPQAEQALLFRQLGADAELRDRLARYQLISDSLGNHLPPRVDAGFHKEIHAALQNEPEVHVETASRIAGLFRPVAGLAVAASVAVVAVLSLQAVREETGAGTTEIAALPVAEDYLRAELQAPVGATPNTPQSLDAYLVNHNEYAVNRGMLPYVRLVGHEMNVNGK